MPFELLLPDGREERADAATTVAASARTPGSQASVLRRVFTKSIAANLLVSMPMVEVGQASFPALASGTTASNVNAGTAKDATAAAFEGVSLDPVRLSARYVFRYEDVARLQSYESVLRRDLTAAMTDAMDDGIINGDGSAPNVNGFLAELTAPADPGAAATWNEHLKAHTDQVDGINAYNLRDLRCVIGKASFTYLETLFRTGAQDNGPRASAQEYVMSRIGGGMVSSRIPAPASNIQLGIIAKTSYPGPKRGRANLASAGADSRPVHEGQSGRGRLDGDHALELQDYPLKPDGRYSRRTLRNDPRFRDHRDADRYCVGTRPDRWTGIYRADRHPRRCSAPSRGHGGAGHRCARSYPRAAGSVHDPAVERGRGLLVGGDGRAGNGGCQ